MRVILNGGKFGGTQVDAPDVACVLAVQGAAVSHLYRHAGPVEPTPEELEARAESGGEPPIPQAVFVGLSTSLPPDAVTVTPE